MFNSKLYELKVTKMCGLWQRIYRQMPTPIDTVSDVFHEWGLGQYPKKPQAE